MPLTFLAAKTKFASYGATVGDQINFVIERALQSGKWEGTTAAVRVAIYDYDDAGVTRRQFTLPREAKTALGIRFEASDSVGTSSARGIRNQWYSWLEGRCSGEWSSGITDIGDGFVTYRDLPSAGRIKVTNSTTESAGSFHLRGMSSGAKTYTGTGALRIEGETLAMPTTANTSTTSATTFDAGSSLYGIVKPVTNGVVSLYHVASDATETLIATYAPGEKVPSYRRYLVPTGSTYSFARVKAKRRFVELVADNDIVFPDNTTALFYGLRGKNYDDKHDDDKANLYWNKFFECLNDGLREEQGNAPLTFRMRPGEGFGAIRPGI